MMPALIFFFVTKMGSYFKKAIFDEHVQEGLMDWAQKVKRRKGNGLVRSSQGQDEPSRKIELQKLVQQTESDLLEGRSVTTSANASWTIPSLASNCLELHAQISYLYSCIFVVTHTYERSHRYHELGFQVWESYIWASLLWWRWWEDAARCCPTLFVKEPKKMLINCKYMR